tara:strand:+ start:379 stop:540 length:162 start_codon:yes stop_codon:yes gene_type:complete
LDGKELLHIAMLLLIVVIAKQRYHHYSRYAALVLMMPRACVARKENKLDETRR